MSKLEDQNTVLNRLVRYGKVSGTMAGLATRLVGERYFGFTIERSDHAEQLLSALGGLKGPLMKIGQILATIPEALPSEYATAFRDLQSGAPPMGQSFVRRRMKAELGPDWLSKFRSFEKTATAAASLGQVHKAVHHDGRQLACKLQYPDMRSAVQADLKQLKVILSLYRQYDSTLETSDILAELSERLYEELDYNLEARHAKLYQFMLKDKGDIHVPEVIDPLSTDRLLTSTWLDGDNLFDFIESPQEIRNKIAFNLFYAWYVPLYNFGIIHGDPHPGNYTVRSNQEINLLDFGCVRIFPVRFVRGVIDLYNALMTDDMDLALHAYETWGFVNLNRDQIETLNIWAHFLYGPLMDDSVRPIGEVTNGIYGQEIAEKVHRKLRESGTIKIPREFVFMDRAALGLGSVFLHLKAELNWYRIFNELIEGFDPVLLANKQNDALSEFQIQENVEDKLRQYA